MQALTSDRAPFAIVLRLPDRLKFGEWESEDYASQTIDVLLSDFLSTVRNYLANNRAVLIRHWNPALKTGFSVKEI